jgi:hypothetical protein
MGIGWSFTYEEGVGIQFHDDDRGCGLWYLGDAEYERAHAPAGQRRVLSLRRIVSHRRVVLRITAGCHVVEVLQVGEGGWAWRCNASLTVMGYFAPSALDGEGAAMAAAYNHAGNQIRGGMIVEECPPSADLGPETYGPAGVALLGEMGER